MDTRKVCSRCKVVKPFEKFYKNKLSKDGHSYQCAECTRLYYYINKENYVQVYIPQLKCSKCKEIKQSTNFHVSRGRKFGYTSQCAQCRNEMSRLFKL